GDRGEELGAADVDRPEHGREGSRDLPARPPRGRAHTPVPMLLAIDVGNSNIVVGVFDGERLVADFRLRTDAHATGDELGLTITGLLRSREVEPASISGVVVSSVVPTL